LRPAAPLQPVTAVIFSGGALALLLIRPLLRRYRDGTKCVALGTVAGLFGPLGALCKSVLKRTHQVEDAGRPFPEHGEMLDRIGEDCSARRLRLP